MSHPITRADVEHIARLSYLALSEDTIATYTTQLGEILDYVHHLAELDLAGVEPTAHPIQLRNVMRADVPGPVLDRAEVLGGAPSVESNLFQVPPVIGDAP